MLTRTPPQARWPHGVALAAVVLGALSVAAATVRPDRAAPVSAKARSAVVVEDQSFEGSFPPPKWQLSDLGEPPGQYTWARTTCTAAPGGGSASVWSVGGGALGGGLGCAGTYGGWAESDLIYGPIDATTFDGGIDVSLYVKLDLHRDSDLQICVTDPGQPAGVSCSGAGLTELEWNYFDPPIAFPSAAGQTDAYVLLRFRDRDPDGTDHGAYVDRVVIRGLSDGAPPTATGAATTALPSASPTRTPTMAPSASASPTGGTAAPSATPSATATRTSTALATGPATSSATATRTGTPPPSATHTPPGPSATTPRPSATPTPGPSATFGLPTPPTVPPEVTASPTPTLEPTSTARPTGGTPPVSTATTTPTVIIGPVEHVIYLPYGTLRHAR